MKILLALFSALAFAGCQNLKDALAGDTITGPGGYGFSVGSITFPPRTVETVVQIPAQPAQTVVVPASKVPVAIPLAKPATAIPVTR